MIDIDQTVIPYTEGVYVFAKTADGSFTPLFKIGGELPTLSDDDFDNSPYPVHLNHDGISAVVKVRLRRKTRDALAIICGYHNATHMRRPRMKQRWRRKHDGTGTV